MVFARLEPTEAAAFRWAGKVIAEVGLQYLAPTVYLNLKEESYDRLLAIAEHPVVSKSVKCLLYETDNLEMWTREQWELCVLGPEYLQAQKSFPEAPGVDASDRDWRAFNREITIIETTPRHTYTKTQMDLALSIYQTFCADQEHVRQHDFFPQKVAQALKNLCNIKCVSSLHFSGVYRRYAAEIEKVLGGWLFSPGPGEGFDKGTKVADISLMRSIFHGVDQADIQLETFCSGNMNWRIFEHDNKDFEALKRSARSLENLTIQFPIDAPFSPPRDSSEWLEATEFRACLQNGRLLEFLMSAPDLTHLELTFDLCETVGAMPFEYIVGDFHWSSLQAVDLHCVAVEEEHLLGFCRRHSARLKDLVLGGLFMREGSWFSVFHSMRRMLKLEDATLYGTFGGGGMGIWEMDPDDEDDEEETYSTPGYTIRQYLLNHDGEDVSLQEYLEDFGIA